MGRSVLKIRPKNQDRTIETTVQGRIRRVSYPAEMPPYAIALIDDALRQKEITAEEADDLRECVYDVAKIDGYEDLLPPQRSKQRTWREWLAALILGVDYGQQGASRTVRQEAPHYE